MNFILLGLGWITVAAWGGVDNSRPKVQSLVRDLIPLYQKLHQNPELSFQEEKTAATLAQELTQAGFQVTSSFGGHGVVGVLKNGQGPSVLLRTDLDALPVKEATGLPFASKVTTKNSEGIDVSVMHACGHDLHITNMVGTAKYLAQTRALWRGTVLIIGQPAEERGAGASLMLKEGLFKKFQKPDYALALHVDASQPAGKVVLISGPFTANVDSMDITLFGRGGHGARPQETIDPIPMASELVLALQTLISREKDPLAPAVITVGSFHAGTKNNIIADSATLQLTIRTFSSEVRNDILAGIRRKAKAIANSYRAPEPQFKSSDNPVSSVINDPKLVEKLRPVFIKQLGTENVLGGSPSTVGEDFSRFGVEGVPSLMFSLGTLSERRLKQYQQQGYVPGLHSHSYFPSAEESLAAGIPLLAESAIDLLKP
jgi:amidohydrolase